MCAIVSLLFTVVYVRLTGLQASRKSPVSVSNLTAETLGLQVPGFRWVLHIQVQVLLLARKCFTLRDISLAPILLYIQLEFYFFGRSIYSVFMAYSY